MRENAMKAKLRQSNVIFTIILSCIYYFVLASITRFNIQVILKPSGFLDVHLIVELLAYISAEL